MLALRTLCLSAVVCVLATATMACDDRYPTLCEPAPNANAVDNGGAVDLRPAPPMRAVLPRTHRRSLRANNRAPNDRSGRVASVRKPALGRSLPPLPASADVINLVGVAPVGSTAEAILVVSQDEPNAIDLAANDVSPIPAAFVLTVPPQPPAAAILSSVSPVSTTWPRTLFMSLGGLLMIASTIRLVFG